MDYDVAPQRPFPTAVLQAYGATAWASRQASLGWDGSRLAVGGQSAGGALAAGVARLTRERRDFTPLLQALLYAPLDLATNPTLKQSRTAKPRISPVLSNTFAAAYIPDLGTRADPLASPALATNLESCLQR